MSTFTRIPFRQQQIGGGGFAKLFKNKNAMKFISQQLLGKTVTNAAMKATSKGAKKTAARAPAKAAAQAGAQAGQKALARPTSTALVPLGSRALVPSRGVKAATTGAAATGAAATVGAKAAKKGFVSKWGSRLKTVAKDPYVQRKIAWKVGKTLTKGAAETGIDILNHHLQGGDPLSRRDIKDITKKAGLNMVTDAMTGKKITSRMARGHIQNATRAKLRTKGRTGRTSAARANVAERMLRLQQLMSKGQKAKRNQMLQGYKQKLLKYRQFGTGLDRGEKKTNKTEKKKKGKKKKKKTIKKKKPNKNIKKHKGKKGLKKMNIKAVQARYHKIKDVFDI